MSIAEKFVAMEYGPAPEDPKKSLPGSIFITAASDILLTARGDSRQKRDTSKQQIPLQARSWRQLHRDRQQTSTQPFEPQA